MSKITQGIYPGALCGIMILILTSLPGSCFSHSGLGAFPGLDKAIHFAMFTLFAFMSLWGYRNTLAEGDKRRLSLAVLAMIAIGVAYGGLTELIQHLWIEGRSGSPFDLIADAAGTVVGTTIYIGYQKNMRKILKNDGEVRK